MQVSKEQIDPCKVVVTMTIPADVVAAAREKTFQQAARSVQVPGFRKGKVPPQMARQYVDQDLVKQRTAETLVQQNYEQALTEAEVKPFAQGDLEMVEMNDNGPLVVKATVPTAPVVTLGPYKNLEIERRRPETNEADVDRQIEEARQRKAEFPLIEDRNAQDGDLLVADLGATVLDADGNPEDVTEPRETVIEVGKNVGDFDSGLRGMAVGDAKEIAVGYPPEYPDERLAGRTARFSVRVREIRARVLPEVDDDFAKSVVASANSVEELRAQFRDNLDKAAERLADMDFEARLIRTIVENSQIHYPEILLQAEMQGDVKELQDRLEQNNMSVEEYLAQNNTTEQEVEEQIAAGANIRILNSLVLSQIAQAEQMTVTEADLDVQIQRRAEQTKVSPAAVRAYAEKNSQMDGFRNTALTEKIIQFLKDSAIVTHRTITRQELEAQESDEETDEVLDELAEEIAEEEAEATPNAVLPFAGGAAPVRRRAAGSSGGGTPEQPSVMLAASESGNDAPSADNAVSLNEAAEAEEETTAKSS